MIAHRYDVLSDPQKRQIYDVYGVEGCVEINQCVGCYFSALARPSWLGRAVGNRIHRAVKY